MNKKKTELIANIFLILTGLTSGVVFFLSGNKDLSLIMFSIALACILYQFLGGIGDANSFQLGAIKFGGTAAIMIGFMFFLKKVIFVPTSASASQEIKISDTGWIPVSIETGKIKPVTISNGNAKMHFPEDENYLNSRKNHEYVLFDKDDQFAIGLKNSPGDTAGSISAGNIRSGRLFNSIHIDEDEKRLQVFTLYPEKDTQNASDKLSQIALPFNIEVFNTSRFSIKPHFNNLEVVPRTSYIIPVSTRESYVVFLEQANSSDSIPANRYSKWLVKKVLHTLDK